MTAMVPVANLIIDANSVLILAFCLWRLCQWALVRSRFRADFGLQLRLLKAVLIFVILSPVLSMAMVYGGIWLWPNAPMTVSDVAVAAYLRGDITMPAAQFQDLLNLRSALLDHALSGGSLLANALIAAVVVGALFFACRAGLVAWKLRRVLARSYVWRRTKGTDLRLSDSISVPFAVRGFVRRHVVLPSDLLLDHDALRIVLAHEFEHLREGDVEWELAFEILRPVLFFNPVFGLWKRAFDQLRETNCDQAVLEQTRITPHQYAECLLSMCERSVRARAPQTFNVAFYRIGSVSARTALENRLVALSTPRRARRGPGVFLTLSAVLAVGIILAAASVRQPGDWSHDRLMLSTIVNLERLEAINSGL